MCRTRSPKRTKRVTWSKPPGRFFRVLACVTGARRTSGVPAHPR
jgi:hypothetical protein